MSLAFNIFGETYDNAVPAFLHTDSPDYVFDRLSGKLIAWSSLNQLATDKGYTFASGEVGEASQDYIDTHPLPFDAANSVTPGEVDIGVSAGITGAGTSGLAIEFTGGPAAANGTVTIAGISVDGTAIVMPGPIDIATADTAEEIATAVGAALDGQQDAGATISISATTVGGTVNLTNAGSGGAGNFDSGATATIA